MKRYLAFAFWGYYPDGGWQGFVSSHDTIDEAKDAAKAAGKDFIQVIDSTTGEEVIV